MAQKITKGRPVKETLKEDAQGVAGGLVFSFPLLYTMEMWRHDFIADPLQSIPIIIGTYLLLVYNRYAGMHKDMSLNPSPFCYIAWCFSDTPIVYHKSSNVFATGAYRT